MKTPERQTVTVRKRVDVALNRAEVEHCLRCWLDQHLAGSRVPHPKTFSDVVVSFDLGEYEHHEPTFEGVTLTYEPAPRAEKSE